MHKRMLAKSGADRMHLGNKDNAIPVHDHRPKEPVVIVGRDHAAETLVRLALEDAQAGNGFAFVGDASRLLSYIPRKRVKDTLLFTLDWDYPRRFNPFHNVPEAERSAVADYVLEAFAAAYPSNSSTPLLDNNLLAASLAMLSVPNGTLYAARHLFTSSAYRTKVIGQLADPDLKDMWRAFDELDEREQRQQAQSVLNRLLPLTTDPWYRTIIGQPKSVAFKDTDIVLIDLPDTRKGTLLAALIMTRLSGRIYIERPRVFVGPGTPVFAVRYLEQLPERLRTQLLGTATILSFRIGVKDARVLEPEFNLRDQDFRLTDLPPRVAYARLDETTLLDMPSPTFPVEPRSRKAIENRSRTPAFASKRAHIEAKIADFLRNIR